MFYIIETKEQLDKLPKASKCFIDLITKSEDAHPTQTSPSVIYYNNFEKGFILAINHSEGFSLDMKDVQQFLAGHESVYLIDGKFHSYYLDLPSMRDARFAIPKLDLDLECYTAVHRDFYQKLQYIPNVNCLIPISKHYEKSECMFDRFKDLFDQEAASFAWQSKFTEVYKWVEEQGICVDDKLFNKYFELTWKLNSLKDGKVYTNYNLYNLTSRPTNAYNGLNFLALPKDKSRAAFIPANDKFIEFDFDGYHIRLIANMLGLEIPTNDSLHTILGRMYFGKEELTPEEYQESKKITFRQLYNGIEDQYRELELFKEIAEFVDAMWKEFKRTKRLILPNGRKLTGEDFTPQKLFNYYVQCLETVNNVKKLAKLKEFLGDKKTRIVLVVYDSILVDFALEDGKSTLNQIRDILQEDGYLVKVKTGGSYDFS